MTDNVSQNGQNMALRDFEHQQLHSRWSNLDAVFL